MYGVDIVTRVVKDFLSYYQIQWHNWQIYRSNLIEYSELTYLPMKKYFRKEHADRIKHVYQVHNIHVYVPHNTTTYFIKTWISECLLGVHS